MCGTNLEFGYKIQQCLEIRVALLLSFLPSMYFFCLFVTSQKTGQNVDRCFSHKKIIANVFTVLQVKQLGALHCVLYPKQPKNFAFRMSLLTHMENNIKWDDT